MEHSTGRLFPIPYCSLSPAISSSVTSHVHTSSAPCLSWSLAIFWWGCSKCFQSCLFAIYPPHGTSDHFKPQIQQVTRLLKIPPVFHLDLAIKFQLFILAWSAQESDLLLLQPHLHLTPYLHNNYLMFLGHVIFYNSKNSYNLLIYYYVSGAMLSALHLIFHVMKGIEHSAKK